MDIVRHVLPPEQGETKWLTSLNAFEAQETVRQAQFKRKQWPELPDGVRVAGDASHSYPHILPDGDDQIEKALLSVVARDVLDHCRSHGIALHTEALNLRSSQICCLNTMFPPRLDLELAREALVDVLPGVTEVTKIDFEYTGPEGTTEWLGEPAGGGRGRLRTSIDVAIWWRRGDDRAFSLCEWKYTESGYGTCGGYRSPNNHNKSHCSSPQSHPSGYQDDCYLSLQSKRHYWPLMDEAGIDLSAAPDGTCCPLRGPFYQLMRQYLVAHYQRVHDPALDVQVVVLSFSGNTALHDPSADGTTVEDRWNRCLRKPEQALRTVHVESVVSRARAAAGEGHQPWLAYLNERYGL